MWFYTSWRCCHGDTCALRPPPIRMISFSVQNTLNSRFFIIFIANIWQIRFFIFFIRISQNRRPVCVERQMGDTTLEWDQHLIFLRRHGLEFPQKKKKTNTHINHTGGAPADTAPPRRFFDFNNTNESATL